METASWLTFLALAQAAWLFAGVLFIIRKPLEGVIMSEVQAAVDATVAQLGKARDEIVAVIAELQAREPSVDLSALQKIAQVLDDVVPDAPVEVPAVEAPAEEVSE